MLPFFRAAKLDSWHHLVTGDESWFFLNTSPRRMWTLSSHDVVAKSKLDIQSQKFMCMIMWNPSGFYLADRLPNNTKMDDHYFVANKLIPFEEAIFPRSISQGHSSDKWHSRRRNLFFKRHIRPPFHGSRNTHCI
jgi:hypothetical protein